MKVRRKRLAKVAESSTEAPPSIAIETHSSTNSHDGKLGVAAGIDSADQLRSVGLDETSPQKKRISRDLSSTDASSGTSTTPYTPNKDSSGPVRSPNNTGGDLSASKMDRDARIVNLFIEQSMLMTVRRESASPPIVFIGDDLGNLLNSSNLTMAIYERVNGESSSDILNATLYFVACYRRMISKEATVPENVRGEVAR